MPDINELLEAAEALLSCNVESIEFTSGHNLEVHLALTKEQKLKGLSLVNHVDISGLLFCYEKPTYIPFTMRNTLVDLDIAWYDATGKIIQYGSYKAQDLTPLVCPRAFSYVLETPAGCLPGGDIRFANG